MKLATVNMCQEAFVIEFNQFDSRRTWQFSTCSRYAVDYVYEKKKYSNPQPTKLLSHSRSLIFVRLWRLKANDAVWLIHNATFRNFRTSEAADNLKWLRLSDYGEHWICTITLQSVQVKLHHTIIVCNGPAMSSTFAIICSKWFLCKWINKSISKMPQDFCPPSHASKFRCWSILHNSTWIEWQSLALFLDNRNK